MRPVLRRVLGLARGALAPPPPAGAPRPTRWIAGQVMPVGQQPLEATLRAFDRLFDPAAPLEARRRGPWSLVPYTETDASPAVREAARRIAEDGGRVLRLRRDGEDVALAGVQPLPSPARPSSALPPRVPSAPLAA